MKYSKMGAAVRPTLSPRYGAAHRQTALAANPAAGVLSTLELRRLVATMVD